MTFIESSLGFEMKTMTRFQCTGKIRCSRLILNLRIQYTVSLPANNEGKFWDIHLKVLPYKCLSLVCGYMRSSSRADFTCS